jgi:hypothetical protein
MDIDDSMQLSEHTNDYETSDEILSITNNIDLCVEHNEEYTLICDCDTLFCNECDLTYNHDRIPDICNNINVVEYWKKYILTKMDEFRDKLNNKIKGLNCMMEIVSLDSFTKQLENIIDTIYVDISHIDNFNKLINDLPISHIIKRKNKILNNTTVIPDDIKNNVNKELISIIDIIIKNHADIHANNECALRWACTNGYLKIVECLIKYGADIHAKDDLAICVASENGHLNIVKCLISHGANINTCNDYSFRYASGCGHLDIVECLISHGIDINARDGHAISYASEYGYLDVVELLIKNGADVHADNEYALQCASKNGHLAVVEYLMKHGADIGKAIKWASYGGHLDVVEYLTKYN